MMCASGWVSAKISVDPLPSASRCGNVPTLSVDHVTVSNGDHTIWVYLIRVLMPSHGLAIPLFMNPIFRLIRHYAIIWPHLHHFAVLVLDIRQWRTALDKEPMHPFVNLLGA
jgi:hypothetical protein